MRGGRFGEEKATFKKNHGSSSKRTIYSCVCVCVCVFALLIFFKKSPTQ